MLMVSDISGSSLIEMLSRESKDFIQIQYLKKSKEHCFIDTRTRETFSYPTPAFIAHRRALAKYLGIAGVAMWELGQIVPKFIGNV